MSKGGSHDPQVVADGCDRSSHARPLDRHWDCPGLRFLRRRIRSRFPWRVRSRLLRRVRWFLSGLLPLWLFPVMLLLLLIAYSLLPETAPPGLAWTPEPSDGLPAPKRNKPRASLVFSGAGRHSVHPLQTDRGVDRKTQRENRHGVECVLP